MTENVKCLVLSPQIQWAILSVVFLSVIFPFLKFLRIFCWGAKRHKWKGYTHNANSGSKAFGALDMHHHIIVYLDVQPRARKRMFQHVE